MPLRKHFWVDSLGAFSTPFFTIWNLQGDFVSPHVFRDVDTQKTYF